MKLSDIKKFCLNPPYTYQGYIAGNVELSGNNNNCCSVQLAIHDPEHPNILPDYIPLRFWDDKAREFVSCYKNGDLIRVKGKLRGKKGANKIHYTYLEVVKFGPAIILTEDEKKENK